MIYGGLQMRVRDCKRYGTWSVSVMALSLDTEKRRQPLECGGFDAAFPFSWSIKE